MHADLQRLLSPRLLEGLQQKPMARLRSLRQEASRAEGDLSFVRRMTQGRLDIVGHERNRRLGSPDSTPAGDGEAGANVSDLLFEMPDILADPAPDPAAGAATPRSGRFVEVLEPGPIALRLGDDLDEIISPSGLSSLEQLDAAGLADLFDQLREFEVALSKARRTLHDQIDVLQDEIARRYRDGEASVDALLEADSLRAEQNPE